MYIAFAVASIYYLVASRGQKWRFWKGSFLLAAIFLAGFIFDGLVSWTQGTSNLERVLTGICVGASMPPVMFFLTRLSGGAGARLESASDPALLEPIAMLFGIIVSFGILGLRFAGWITASSLAILGFLLLWTLVAYCGIQSISRLVAHRPLRRPKWLPLPLSITAMAGATFAANQLHHYLRRALL